MTDTLPDLIDAQTAMTSLGVKAQTLYAYVSRGLIRSVSPDKRKASLYYREDIEALQMRGRTRKASDNMAQRALRTGGGAVMQTTITDITEQGPRYRGHLAADLALGGRSFEQCAELLWSGLLPAAPVSWEPAAERPPFGEFVRVLRLTARSNSSRRVLALAVEAWASCLGASPEMSAAAPIIAARDVVQVMTGCIGLLREKPAFTPCRPGQSVAESLARSLGIPGHETNLRLLDVALVVCADHELAPATFAARIAASAGADIYSCISSALGAFEGMSTGLGCDLAEQLLRSSGTPKSYVAALAKAARQKHPLPGYNHAIYPHGDPRATALLEHMSALGKLNAKGSVALRCVEAAHAELGAEPSLGVALAVMGIAFDHPQGSAAAVMALGRCAGWIAHIYEQRMAGFLVRPRAKYVGLAP